jgi:glucose/arabinose dehydrogenase
MKNLLPAVAVAIAAGAATGTTLAQVDAVPQSAAKIDALRQNLARIKLPPGFKIEVYALVPYARQMAVAPGGGVTFVGTRSNRVYTITDRSRRGVADKVGQFAPALDFRMPNGVCFAQDGVLYVAEQNRVLAFPAAASSYENREVAPTAVVAQGQLIPPDDESDNHSARVCRIGPDDKLYIALGQPYNVPPPGKLDGYAKFGIGGIIRIDRDGGHREVYARGIRNSVGLDFNPADNTLWFTDNQVDRMGDDIPPGELNRATRSGQNFGFPWYGGGHVRTNEYRNATPPADLVFPQVEMDAHAADLGMTFYTGTQFPAKYRGGIFSAQHGSWDRSTPIGARVMFTPLAADGTADHAEVFASGWLTERGDYLGRPVDVALLADGSLLVPDDFAGAVYRISFVP